MIFSSMLQVLFCNLLLGCNSASFMDLFAAVGSNWICPYLLSIKLGGICFRWQLGVDGNNGYAVAIYSKENLLNNVLAAIPLDLNRDEWFAALPRALVAGFVKTDKDFQEKGMGCFCEERAGLVEVGSESGPFEFLGMQICFICSILVLQMGCTGPDLIGAFFSAVVSVLVLVL
ncbi:putative protein phosphatase 2C 12 [Camellia lanceoleosa]|uniref:Uncharacterized protein n=1 Tax=Camellia lanceoleosa TaxID=1840588 RepID=A0ACC0GCG2_9ERIC|nr:putative protein phosphatase 2C 12 [Camellia lanceoleosa]